MRELRAQRPTIAWGGRLGCALSIGRSVGRDAREIVSRLTGCDAHWYGIERQFVSGSRELSLIDVRPGGGLAFMISACGVDHRFGFSDGTSGRRWCTVNEAAAGIAVDAATRAPHRHAVYCPSGTVAHELDQQMKVAPSIALGQGERGHWPPGPCERGPFGRPRTLNRKTGGDVHQGTRARTYTHSTPPWGQQRMRCWSFDGAFALSGHPNQPSCEVVEMT